MTSPANQAHEALIKAQAEEDDERRYELIEEVRITALLLVAQELEFIANAFSTIGETLTRIFNHVDEVIQHEIREDADEEE